MNKLETVLNNLENKNIDELKNFTGLKLKDIGSTPSLDTTDLETLRQCSLSEFYTPDDVIDMIYAQLTANNITTGNILEPSCGIGKMIRNNTNFKYTGVELSPISSKIARLLHPDATIYNCDFKDFKPNQKFEIIIGNVPFVSTTLYDPAYKNLNLKVHEYFVYKCIDLLADKGVLILVVPTSLLNNQTVLQKITNDCSFKRVINLHNKTFKDTNICTSIICMQKTNNIDVLNTNNDLNLIDNISINLGLKTAITNRFGKRVKTLNPITENDSRVLRNMLEENKERAITPWSKFEPMPIIDDIITETPAVTEPIDKQTQDLNNLYDKLSECIKNKNNTELNNAYDWFILKYGQLHNKKNMAKFANNNKFYAVLSLEKLKPTTDPKDIAYEKSDILTKDIFSSIKPIDLTNCDFDTAKNLSYNNKGCFDIDYISDLTKTPIDILQSQFDLKIDPVTEKLVTKEEYYSGDIRAKINILKISQLNIIKDIFDNEVENYDELPIYIDPDKLIMAIARKHNLVTTTMLTDDLYTNLMTYSYDNEMVNNIVTDNDISSLQPYIQKTITILRSVYNKIVSHLNQTVINQINDLESKVQTIPADELRITPATYWIPMFIFEKFTLDVLDIYINSNTHFPSITRTKTNEIIATKTTKESPKDNEYGCVSHTAFGVLVKIMTNSPLKVYTKGPDDKPVLDYQNTILLQQRAEKLKDAFRKYVISNYASYIETLYKETFATHKIKEITGDYLLLENTNKNITLEKHQKDAIAKIINNKNTLLGHCVGAGKTYTMIAGIMELKRLNFIKKALFIVPNNLIPATVESFHTLYPTANVCFADEESFEPGNRKAFINNIAMNNYDAVIIGHSQFIRISVSENQINNVINEEVSKINDLIYATKINEALSPSAKHTKIRSLTKKKIQLEEQINKLIDVNKETDCLTFEDLGVDCLVVDEAHIYKNLYTPTSLSNIAGVSTTNSKQAFDMYLKTRYINELPTGRIIFATGTPISNSVNELYTIQRYLEPWELYDKNIHSFDDWVSIFGKVESVIELDPTATTFRQRDRIVKYYSLPELITALSQIADIKNESDLNLPTPTETTMIVEIEPSNEQKNAIHELAKRVDEIKKGNVDPAEDNMLTVTNDGKKIALDLRLYDEEAKDNSNSKVNYLVSNVLNVYKQFPDKTQLIFCDMSTPKPNVFNVYDDIKEKLTLFGIPEHEIKYIHEAKTKQQEENLHNLVRQGKVKILIGSTSKLGTGVNVQDKLIAIHDLDIPWRPSDLEQRAGRIKRRGNTNSHVLIYRYITAKTFDAYLWQTLENKQRFISTIMTNRDVNRIVNNDDTTTLNFAEAKALAMGDSRLKDYVELQNEQKKLEIQLKGIYQMMNNTKHEIRLKLQMLIRLQKTYNLIKQDMEYLQSLDNQTISNIANTIMPVGIDKESTDKKLKLIIQDNKMALYNREEIKVLDIYGFNVSIRGDILDNTKKTNEIVIKRNATYSMRINMQESIVDRIFKLIIGISEKLKTTYDSYMEKYTYLEKMIGKEELENCLQTESIEVKTMQNPEVGKIKQRIDEIDETMNTLKTELNV